jgi:uncharacterized membrane protein (DUF106 family)
MAEKVAVPPPKKPAGGSSMFIMMFMMLFMLIIAMDPTLRTGIGTIAGFGLNPVLGFNGAFPVWTIVLAAFLVSLISSLVRQFVVDWETVARFQKKNAYIAKLSSAAFKKRDMEKVARIGKLRQEMMGDSMAVQSSQMKPTAITGILFFAILMWMWLFMASVPHPFMSIPWADGFMTGLNASHVFPDWMLLYSLLSIVLGQIIGRALKLVFFARALKKLAASEG